MSRLPKTISVEKLDNSVLFTFAQNQHYLYDGTIEVPFNSLSIIADKSEAITLRKSASNDIFISAPWQNFDINASSKEEAVDVLTDMLYDETGISQEEVQDMIDAATSGIPSSQVVEQLRTDVNTISGDVANKQDRLVAGDNITISGNVISAEAGNNIIELTQAEYDALTEKDPDALYIITDAQEININNYYTKSEVYNKQEVDAAYGTAYQTLTAHTADTTVHFTGTQKSNYDGLEGQYYVDDEWDIMPQTVFNHWATSEYSVAMGQFDQRITANESAVTELKSTKLDASAYTPTDLSQYWTSGQTQNAINAATSGIPSSQVIEALRSDINTVSGDVENKQDALSAGTGIEISGNVISATGGALFVDFDDLMNNMNDDKWDELVDAIQNNKPIFYCYDYSEGDSDTTDAGQSPVDGYVYINEGEESTEIGLKKLYGGGYRELYIVKNGSEDYEVTDNSFDYQPLLQAGSGISIDSDNVISVTADSELDETSNNPVANSAVTTVIIDDEEVISRAINELNDRLVVVESGGTGGGITSGEVQTMIDDSLDIYWTSAQTQSAIDNAKAYYVDFAAMSVRGITDADWDGLVAAINAHRPILVKVGTANGYVNATTAGIFDNTIIVTGADEGNASKYTFTKNGSNDYSVSISTKQFVTQAEKDSWNAKADASTTYTKTEVNNLVNNKFWCGTQAQYDALATKENDVLYLIHE